MNRSSAIGVITAAALAISGCSTRPRNFSAEITAPVANRTAFETDYRTCQTLVSSGRKDGFKAAASTAAVGAGALGAGVAVGGAVTAGGTASGWGAVGAGAGTAMAAATVVAGVAGFGITRLIRGGRERKFKRGMTACLAEYGYAVEGWAKLKKREDAAQYAANAVPITAQSPMPEAAQTLAPTLAAQQE